MSGGLQDCETGKPRPAPAQAVSGQCGPVWASLRITGFGAVWARSKSKQEKGGGIAMLPTSGSRRPAMPVVSRDSGLSRAQVKIGVIIPRFPENRVEIPINGSVTANIQRLLYKPNQNTLIYERL